MAIPIILIHRSNSNYLPYTIAQARRTNPKSPLFLIGDESNRYGLVEHELISKYLDSATKFAHVYQHLSTNPIEYELFCFQRWFILKDFMSRHAFDQCFYLDSDVMLYEDITLDQQRLQHYEIALTADTPSSIFVNNLASLERFCTFVFNLYQNSDSLQRIKFFFKEQLQSTLATSISDMFAFAAYRKQYPHKVGDLLEINNDSTYDALMTAPDGFEMVNGIKKIHFRNQQPFGNHLESGRVIRFKSLHFQGNSKRYIKDYFVGDQLPERVNNASIDTFSSQQESQSKSRVAHCYTVIETQPSNAEAHYDLGCALLEQGQTSDAIYCFQVAIQLLPTFLGAYINLGVALIQQNQVEEAILCYQNALELQPSSALAYGNLGYAYAEAGQTQASEYCTAMCNALEIVTLRPDWAEAHRNLGLAYQQFGKLNEAIACFQQALDRQPDFLAAQIDLQNALLNQNVQQQTIHLRAINLIMFPDWKQALEVLYLDLKVALNAVFSHPQQSEITLLIYIDNPTEAHSLDIETTLNEVMFDLLMTQALDINESPGVCPLNRLTSSQWDALFPQIKAWIRLKHEDLTVIPETIRQKLVALELDVQEKLHL